MMDTIRKKGWGCTLSPETTGKHSALGSLEETIRLVKETKCSFNIDFAHLYARNYGKINYAEILDKLQASSSQARPVPFLQHKLHQQRREEPRGPGHHPPFEPLAKEILERKLNITIICESPVTCATRSR